MSLVTWFKRFRRQCSLRLRLRRQRSVIEDICRHYPADEVKSIAEIFADMDEIITSPRDITNWWDFIKGYFCMGINYKGRKVGDYVWFFEWMTELDKLFATVPEQEKLLDNKNKFSRLLAENGLRGTQGLGLMKAVEGRPVVVSPQGEQAPLADVLREHGELFCKPQEGCQGTGCIKLANAAEGCIANGKPMGWEQFIRESGLGEGNEMQVEQVVRQHPVLSAFHPNAINTLRLTTMRDEQTGKPAYWQGAMRMGTGDSVVDNVAQGGVCVGFDSKGNLLTPGYAPQGYAMPSITHHPTSGIAFEGVTIPFFEEAKQLVCDAHALASENILFLSWDVAITPDGPLIIECNTRGDITFQQMLHGGWYEVYETRLKPAVRRITGGK